MNVSLDDQKLLAAHLFPQEWLATYQEKFPEKRRRKQANLRRRALAKVVIDAHRANGESCATCAGYSIGYCLPNSDFHGNQVTKPESICSDWSARQ